MNSRRLKELWSRLDGSHALSMGSAVTRTSPQPWGRDGAFPTTGRGSLLNAVPEVHLYRVFYMWGLLTPEPFEDLANPCSQAAHALSSTDIEV